MDIIIKKAGPEDIDAFIAFTHEVQDRMERREWLWLDPDGEVRDMMARGIMELWLAMDGGRIAGAFNVLHPGTAKFSLGHDLGLSDEDLLRVTHMETAVVHPDYRGQGLQRKMMAFAEAALPGRILLATVHPDNRYSLRNVLALGYTIEKKLEKYDSVRYLLRKG